MVTLSDCSLQKRVLASNRFVPRLRVLMPDGADRREARRFLMSLPMRVLPREAHNKELHANTRDVSYRGLYFLFEAKFEIGIQIDFVLTPPQKGPKSGEVYIRCP